MGSPLRIQMLGLLPAVLKPCGPACAQPFTNANVRALVSQQLQESPPIARENADLAHKLVERLVGDFGERIAIEVVGLDSPKGLWLGLRHRVGTGFALIVGGREVLRNPLTYEAAREAIERRIAESIGSGQ